MKLRRILGIFYKSELARVGQQPKYYLKSIFLPSWLYINHNIWSHVCDIKVFENILTCAFKMLNLRKNWDSCTQQIVGIVDVKCGEFQKKNCYLKKDQLVLSNFGFLYCFDPKNCCGPRTDCTTSAQFL